MSPAREQHQSNRRRRSRRVHERSRVSLFDVFRESFERKDAARRDAERSEGSSGTSVLEVSQRSNARRIGVDEETLRRHVHNHLATLMNTIRIDAAVDLSDCPNVQASVVNYGFQDMSNLSRKELNRQDVVRSITQSLRDHEPRLIPDSIRVKVITLEEDVHARVCVHVTADLIADPADIPVEFQADIDTGAGKVLLTKSRL